MIHLLPCPVMKTNRFIKFCVVCPLLVLALAALFSAVVMGLWNAILPEVTGATTITFWQAAGILILAKILFGGWWGGRCGGRRWRQHMVDHDRWHALAPGQREQMREEMRRRFGDWPSPECCSWHGPEKPAVDKPAP